MRREAVSRRGLLLGVLAGAGAVVLTASGCREQRWHPHVVTPEESALRAAVDAERRLVVRYETALAGDPDDDAGTALENLLASHERQLAALRERLPEEATTADPEDTALQGHEPAPVPEEPPGVAALRVAEEDVAVAHTQRATQVDDPGLAQLFASLAAAASGNTHLLAGL